ncbi:MAG: radical SAM protein [Nitrospirae bacterium]|nr:radical SAM protein [Nitrospirota bacterium]
MTEHKGLTILNPGRISTKGAGETKKILLFTAPRPRPDYTPLHFGDNRAPQGLGYVAAYLERFGHICKIVDLYAFTWKFKGVVTEVKSPWRKKQDKSGLNWQRTMDGDLNTVEDHSRGGFNQNNSDGTIDLGTDLEAVIDDFKPDFIGMYIHTMSFDTAVELSAALKKYYPETPQMCGGPHPSVMPETLPESFDFVVMGEGEESALGIVEGREKNRIIKGVQIAEDAMDFLPWPNIDHFWEYPYNWGLKLFGHGEITPTVSLNTSRGCPFPCKFCGVQDVSGGRFRHVSARRIFEHVVWLQEKYGAQGIYFREDNFTVSLQRVEEFCDLIIENGVKIQWACESRVNKLSPQMIEKMAKSGCVGLYIGVESGSDRVLQFMQKLESRADFLEKFPILHSNGISTYTTWIYGAPTETPEDRRETDSLIEIIKPTTIDAFIYLGIPKSDWYRMVEDNNWYEFKDRNGFIYPTGYLGYARELYGVSDPRVEYVERIYSENNISPVLKDW